MTVRKRVLPVLAMVAAIAFAISGIAVMEYLPHINDGPRHTFVLSGSAVLTDEQAIDFGHRTLVADGRLEPGMEFQPIDDTTLISRGDDKSFCSVCWGVPKTVRCYYVQLHRTPGQVEAVSSPGK